MLCEYKIAFNDNKYNEYANKIANGILLFQKEDGSLNHVLNMSFKLKDKYRTTYYDGEAAYSLLKYYGISNNKKYYRSAKKIVDMFIKKNYTKYSDQWVSYSLNEFLKYDSSDKYVKFALDNYSNNNFDKKTSFSPISLELFNNKKIMKLLDDHRNRKRDNYKKVWAVYCFLVWYDEFFIKN